MISRPDSLFFPELRARAELLERVHQEFVARFPKLAEKDALTHPNDPADERIKTIREKLTQKRYRVGFLGTSQAGKSTTLNSYIDREKLLPQGNSMSCTSIRIRFFRNSAEEGYRVRFIYMTRAGYRLRRDDIAADLLKLYDRHIEPPLSDDEVLARLDEQSFTQKDDIKVGNLLRRMIDAGKVHAASLGDHRKTEDVGIDELRQDADVSDLLQRSATHDGKGNAKWSLLEEIQLGIPNLELPENVELVDLPGLSTTRGADDQYTLRAAKELNGAVVVISVADNVARPEIFQIVKELRKEFENDSSRVWIIGNKTDGVSRENLTGPPGTNIVDTIAKVLGSHWIDPRHFLFTSNELYTSHVSAAEFLSPKGIHFDESGRPMLSSAFDSHPVLKSAFSEFCHDGGIAALKRVINGTMEPAIRRGLNAQIDRSIVQLAERLHAAVANARRAAEAGTGGRAVARKWCGAIEQVVALINHNIDEVTIDASVADELAEDLLEKLSRHTRGVMRGQLDEALRFAGPHETGPALKIRFIDATEAMRTEGERTFETGGEVRKYFDKIVSALAKASHQVPDPVGIPNPPKYLRGLFAAAFKEPWASRLSQDFRSLVDPVLIDHEGGIRVNLTEFKTIMRCKADQVVRQREYRYRNFVVSQLRGMLDQLREYTPPEVEIVNLDTSVYDSLLNSLDRLRVPLLVQPEPEPDLDLKTVPETKNGEPPPTRESRQPSIDLSEHPSKPLSGVSETTDPIRLTPVDPPADDPGQIMRESVFDTDEDDDDF